MMYIKGNKGFTLAELLIVVAIISVLVGISIPVFNSQLEKSREARDLANVRSAYAEVMLCAITGDDGSSNGVTYVNNRWYKMIELSQQESGWQTSGPLNIGGVSSENNGLHWVGSPSPNGYCTVSYTESGGIVIAWEYNFSPIMTLKIKDYQNRTVLELIDTFTMFESSGRSGRTIKDDIRNLLGMTKNQEFAYKMLPTSEKDVYEIYVSTDRELKIGVKASQPTLDKITVTGYKYRINPDGSSTLIQIGTPQTVSTFVNKNGEEKIDVRGNCDKQFTIPSTDEPHIAYEWSK